MFISAEQNLKDLVADSVQEPLKVSLLSGVALLMTSNFLGRLKRFGSVPVQGAAEIIECGVAIIRNLSMSQLTTDIVFPPLRCLETKRKLVQQSQSSPTADAMFA